MEVKWDLEDQENFSRMLLVGLVEANQTPHLNPKNPQEDLADTGGKLSKKVTRRKPFLHPLHKTQHLEFGILKNKLLGGIK